MITGVVNAQTEATIRLPVRAADGREQEIKAVLDTGFNGSLTLPPAVIANLGLQWRTRGLVISLISRRGLGCDAGCFYHWGVFCPARRSLALNVRRVPAHSGKEVEISM
jgi:hypothetical protein